MDEIQRLLEAFTLAQGDGREKERELCCADICSYCCEMFPVKRRAGNSWWHIGEDGKLLAPCQAILIRERAHREQEAKQ